MGGALGGRVDRRMSRAWAAEEPDTARRYQADGRVAKREDEQQINRGGVGEAKLHVRRASSTLRAMGDSPQEPR